MTSKTITTASPTRRARRQRLLAFVLLLLVTHAATAEAAHKHCNLPLDRSDQAATFIGNRGDAGSALTDSVAFSDCLICQLQQQLSISLFSTTPQIVLPLTQAIRFSAVELCYLSDVDAPHRGRAPPLASLSL